MNTTFLAVAVIGIGLATPAIASYHTGGYTQGILRQQLQQPRPSPLRLPAPAPVYQAPAPVYRPLRQQSCSFNAQGQWICYKY